MGDQQARLRVTGMTCAHCQQTVERALRGVPGVSRAAVDLAKAEARVAYDPKKTSEAEFVRAIEGAGYSVQKSKPLPLILRAAIGLAAIALVYLGMRHVGSGALADMLPLAQEGMGFGMLFVIGLITSVHCVVMCGGIALSQCMGKPSGVRPSILYNLGRVIAYTVVGALVGALGAVVSFSGAAKGVIQTIAGGFMILMGLNMTGLFPWVSRLIPRMPGGIAKKLNRARGSGPLVVGLLNGLMPCGPLQAMQIYALSSGSWARGALSMLLFSLGTVPLMFALGALGGKMSAKFNRRAMAVGAVLVAALGLTMLSGGLTLAGVAVPGASAGNSAASDVAGDVQRVSTTLQSGRYAPITVVRGVPVEWTIDAPKGTINGCNNRMFIPEYGIEHKFAQGENVITFTPEETGVFPYSCWMGMISSAITVVEPGESVETAQGALPSPEPAAQSPLGCACCN